ncbi:MAG: DNA repair protein RecO [Peptoniphilaceae bacterium]|nr:DNA repair protein RecO [Peptoniphilaceae bacterium]
MATNELNDITGFVLREFPYRETSKIIEVFTDKIGRISIIAKGVLKKNSKNLALTNRFMKVNYSLYSSGKDFYGIREGRVIESYKQSQGNFDIILYKSAICDLLLKTIDGDQVDEVYNLLDKAFEAFEEADYGQINIFLGFLIKYLSFSGLKPNFYPRAIRGKIIGDGRFYFSIEEASLVRADYKVEDKVYLSHEDLNYFLGLLYTPSDKLAELRQSPDYQKVGRLIIDYCLSKLDLKKFSSMDWVYKQLSERNTDVL